MNQPLPIALGAASLAPAAGILVSAPVIWDVFNSATDATAASSEVAGELGPVHVALAIAFPLALFFAWHVLYRDRRGGVLHKLLWVLAIFLLAPVSLPVYWQKRFWSSAARTEPQLSTTNPAG